MFQPPSRLLPEANGKLMLRAVLALEEMLRHPVNSPGFDPCLKA